MDLSGPQSERDNLFSGRNQNHPIRDEFRYNANQDDNSNTYESEISRLRLENSRLSNLLQRSLKELKVYQVQYPSAYESVKNSVANNDDGEEDMWPASSSEAVAPLLSAFDTRINELETKVKQQAAQLDHSKKDIEVLVRENEELRQSNFEGVKNVGSESESYGAGLSGLGPTGPLQAELYAEFNERIDILMDENALLVQQKVFFSTELDKYSEELNKKSIEINSLSQKLNESSTNLQHVSQQATQMEKERNEAANQALNFSDSLGKAEIEIETLNDQIPILKQKSKDTDSVILNLRKQIKGIQDKSDEDGQGSLRRVKLAEDRVRELHVLLSGKTQELDTAKEVNRKIRSEYQNTRQDAEGMLQVMSGLERQLNEHSTREAEVERMAKESKERMEEALTIKEQFLAVAEQNKREIERLIAERKTIALQRKDEIEEALNKSRSVLTKREEAFDTEINELALKNAQLLFDAEKAKRGCLTLQETKTRMQRTHDDFVTSITADMKGLNDKLMTMTVAKEQEVSRRSELQDQNKELRSNVDHLRNQLEGSKFQCSQIDKNKDIELSSHKVQVKELQKEMSNKIRLVQKQAKELEDLKASMDSKLLLLEKKFSDENAMHRKKALDSERQASELESNSVVDEQRMQTLIDQLKEKYEASSNHFELKLKIEVEQQKALSQKARNADQIIADLLEERNSLQNTLEETEERLRQQEETSDGLRTIVFDVSSQLSASHSAREEGAQKAARAIEESSALNDMRAESSTNYAAHAKDGLMSWVSLNPISRSSQAQALAEPNMDFAS